MINLISRQASTCGGRGPYKVFRNLVKGLERIGYPFVVNRHPTAAARLWIQDDVQALRYMHKPGVYPVVGPNLFVMPSDVDPAIDLSGAIYVQPCDWAARVWHQQGFRDCPIASWAVGIDTDVFAPAALASSPRSVLVYHKLRDPQELVMLLEVVRRHGLLPKLVLYGAYDEEEYQRLLSEVCFVVWHGGAESQGIALLEALACDVPVLVCDVQSLRQTRGGYPFMPDVYDMHVTAAPYFDDRCGIRIRNWSELDDAVVQMVERREAFRPREFVLESLSLEKQAHEFVDLWSPWGLTYETGLREGLRNGRRWTGPPLSRRILIRMRRRGATTRPQSSAWPASRA